MNKYVFKDEGIYYYIVKDINDYDEMIQNSESDFDGLFSEARREYYHVNGEYIGPGIYTISPYTFCQHTDYGIDVKRMTKETAKVIYSSLQTCLDDFKLLLDCVCSL